MKTNELKEYLRKCDETKKEKIISLLYRKVPKNIKEEVDNEIVAIVNGVSIQKVVKERFDFASFKEEVETFIDNAYERYYFIPNKVISKKDRPKWRFKVMNYIKTINSIDICDENYDEANKLLIKIYDVLSYACGVYLFNTNDAFSSIGIRQHNLYILLTERMLKKDRSDETFNQLIERATNGFLDAYNLHEYMMNVLIDFLKGKEELLHIKELTKKIYAEGGFGVDRYASTSVEKYYKKEADNNLLLFVYYINLRLGETFSDLDYFMHNYKDYDLEIGLYILLCSLGRDADDQEWVEIYEYITKKYKIEARDSLKEEYKERKERIQN